MSTGKRRIFEPEFKVSAVQRVMAGERAAAVCDELEIRASQLAKWCAKFRRDGPKGLRRAGRPRKSDAEPEPMGRPNDLTARERISELERKIGQQQIELDFFRRALRHVREARRPSDGPGVMTSTRSSRR